MSLVLLPIINLSLSPKTAHEDRDKKQTTKYSEIKRNKGKNDFSSAKREMPDIHASQALGLSHCRRTPSMNVGQFTRCAEISGLDLAIL
jgi:hypothetical protein